MASFAQQQPQQFSSYVSPVDVNLYANVLQQKQQQYDLGVQKVQGVIDTISGIEVVKDAHKQYLNDSFSNLENELKTMVNADFSKTNTVNQAYGMAAKIAKDPVIVNAMRSTAKYKKALADRDVYIKDKKSSVQNDWFFNQQVNEWLSNEDVNADFNAQYTPYTDITNEFLTLYKQVKPDSKLTSDAVTVTPTGQIALTPQGEVLMNMESSGIDEGKINEIWQSIAIRPDIKQQLYINGNYNYNGYNKQNLLDSIRKSYDRTILETNSKILKLKSLQATDKTVDPTQVSQQVTQLEKINSNLSNQYKALTSLSEDKLKAQLYETDTQRSLMNTFSYTKDKTTYNTNPFFKAKMDRLNYDLAQSKLNKDKGIASTSTIIRNIEAEQGMLGSGTFNQKLDNYQIEIDRTRASWVNSLAAESQQPLPYIENPQGGYLPNPNYPGGVEAAKMAGDNLYSTAYQTYSTGTANSTVRQMFDEMHFLQRDYDRLNSVKQTIEKRFSPKLNELISKIPQISGEVSVPEKGRLIDFNQEDLVNLWLVKNNKDPNKEVENKIKEKFGKNGVGELAFRVSPAYKRANKSDTTLKSYEQISKILKSEPELGNIYLQKEEEYKRVQRAFETPETLFNTGDTKTFQTYASQYANIIGNIKDIQNKVGGNASSQASKALEIIGGSKDGKYDKDVSFGYYFDRVGNQYYLTVRKGENSAKVPVDQKDISLIPGASIQQDPFWQRYGSSLSMTSGQTTQVNSSLGDKFAYRIPLQPLSPGSNKRNYDDIRYHLVKAGGTSETPLYKMLLYVYDKNGNRVLDGYSYGLNGQPMTKSQVLQATNSLGNDVLIQGIIDSASK